MRKLTFSRALRASALAAVFMTGGCALPVGVQVAIFALDGFTLMATQKTIADHGISAASGQDCALYRVVTAREGEGGVCRDSDSGTALAENSGASADDGFAPVIFSDPEADLEYAAAEAAGVIEERRAADALIAAAAPESVTPDVVTPDTAAPAEALAENAAVADTEDAAGAKLREAEITDGRYIVIGTFRTMINAEQLALKRRAFEPRVLVTELRSGSLYRVVIGPYEEGKRRTLTRELAKAGMFDVWAMGVIALDWPNVWAPAPALQIAETGE